MTTGLTTGAFTSLYYVAPVIYTHVATAKKKTSSRRPTGLLRPHSDLSSAWWRVAMFDRV